MHVFCVQISVLSGVENENDVEAFTWKETSYLRHDFKWMTVHVVRGLNREESLIEARDIENIIHNSSDGFYTRIVEYSDKNKVIE